MVRLNYFSAARYSKYPSLPFPELIPQKQAIHLLHINSKFLQLEIRHYLETFKSHLFNGEHVFIFFQTTFERITSKYLKLLVDISILNSSI